MQGNPAVTHAQSTATVILAPNVKPQHPSQRQQRQIQLQEQLQQQLQQLQQMQMELEHPQVH